MRIPIIAGNWKMNMTLGEAEALVKELKASCETDSVQVVVCPPFTALSSVNKALQGSSIALGAQDLFWEPKGAFTGEVAAPMLTDVGCKYVIIGHSERRANFGETDEIVHRKLLAAIRQVLTPIVAIGETLAQREANKTFEVLERQLSGALSQCPEDVCGAMILAYEPVWAIGTGKNATPEQVQEAHAFIRKWISGHCGSGIGEAIRIQYGGSVTGSNARSLMQQADVDGALVGGASLKPDSFSAIVKAAAEVKEILK